MLCSEADDKPPRTPNPGPGRAGGEENLKKIVEEEISLHC